MCGIAGIIKRKGRTLSETDHRTVDRMVALMHHRGPDASGTWENPESTCLFGHARLSIIDLVGSPQPMVADSDAITYNGELYNYRELRRLLEAKGRAFRTDGDTEVLLQSLREWGSTAVDEFDGMYAVGFWENKSQRLLLLRDPFGIKPLFYAFAEECLAFASELTALSAVPGVDRGLASDSLVEFLLHGYVPSPKTIFRGVRKLPPGHWLQYDRQSDTIELRRYWTPRFDIDSSLNESAAVESLHAGLDLAVRSHLVSDVPVGAFLSGGIDSSLVVSYMVTHGNRKAYTAEFAEPEYNEAPHAEAIAKHLGAELTKCPVSVSDSLNLIRRLAQVYDEPFADSSALPTYLVCEKIRENVTVALSGDGGDEMLGGYKRYQEMARFLGQAERKFAQPLRRSLQRWIPTTSKVGSKLHELSETSAEYYQRTMRIFSEPQVASVLRDRALLNDTVRFSLLADSLDQSRAPDAVTAAQLCDIATYLPEDNLTKVDRASMAHSLEVRVPYLSKAVWAAASRLPLHWRVAARDGRTKVALRALASRRLPEYIGDLPKKGFSIPAAKWFQGELMKEFQEVVHGSPLIKEYFDGGGLERIMREHLDGVHRHHQRLWGVMMLALWGEVHNV